jgi:hypothetical protein
MLRNLNRTLTRGRVCGTPKTGVLGSAIASTGDYGAGYCYNDLDLPADANKEICGRVTAWPSAGTLFAYEDTSFSFTGAPDGIYTFQYQLYVDGVATGSPATVTLLQGDVGALLQATPAAIATATASLTTSISLVSAATSTATATAAFPYDGFLAEAFATATSTANLTTSITLSAAATASATVTATLQIDGLIARAEVIAVATAALDVVDIIYANAPSGYGSPKRYKNRPPAI